MPWFLEAVPVTSGIDWLVSLLRMAIADQTTSVVQVVKEPNNILSSGLADEVFYTQEMPIVSGVTTYLRIGRWSYSKVNSVAEAEDLRAYMFNEASGAFRVPDGAVYGVSGGKVYLSYSWEEEQTYTYQDSELRLYIQDAVAEVDAGYYDFGYSTSGAGSAFDITPEPGINDVASYVYVKYAAYLMKRRQEAEGFDNRIYVRDLNVTIDTAKGLGDIAKSAKDLLVEISDIATTLHIKGQESAVALIDTYSTYVAFNATDNYAHRFIKDGIFYE